MIVNEILLWQSESYYVIWGAIVINHNSWKFQIQFTEPQIKQLVTIHCDLWSGMITGLVIQTLKTTLISATVDLHIWQLSWFAQVKVWLVQTW